MAVSSRVNTQSFRRQSQRRPRVAPRLLQFTVVWRAVYVTRQTTAQSRYAGPCRDAEQQQNQCQAFVAVVTLAANPRAHQLQSRHFDVQGSSDVLAAVPEITAE